MVFYLQIIFYISLLDISRIYLLNIKYKIISNIDLNAKIINIYVNI